MKRLEVINEDTLELSPFVGVLKFRAVRFRGSQYKLDEGVMLPVSYVVDKQESCKLYRDMDINCMLMGLGYRALQLFNWVALTIEKDRDWVQINEDLFCKRAGIGSKKTFKAALNELIRYQVLLGTHYSTVYWVNPYYLFNGDRLKKYKNNVEVVYKK